MITYKVTMNLPTLSKAAINILSHGYGFRSDEQSEMSIPEITDPKKIMQHEMYDLGNADIPDFVEFHYVPKKLHGKLSISDIDKCLKNLLRAKSYRLIWLCADKNDAQEYADNTNSIYQLALPKDPKKYALISDLGNEGCLFAYNGKLTELVK